MSNYSQTTFFTPKDTLPVNNPAKTIFGAAYDVEFGNISTAIASKADSTGVVLSLTAGSGIGLTASVGAITISNTGVLSIAGTANQIAASAATGAVTLSFPQNVIIPTPASGTSLTVNPQTGNGTRSIDASGINIAFGTFLLSGASEIASANALAFGTTAATALSVFTNALVRLTIAASGAVTIASPTSGTPLSVNGINGNNVLALGSTSASSTLIAGYQNVLAGAWSVSSQSTDGMAIGSDGAASLQLFTNSSTRLTITAAGNVSIAAPGSSTALTVTGTASANTLVVQASTSTGNSGGVLLNAGTTSGDNALVINNAPASVQYLRVAGDGGVILAAATGGDQGLGTLNATGVFINGVAVSTSAGTTGTFTGTLATGGTTTPTVSCKYTKVGTSVTLRIGLVTYTSNATGMTLTGLPSAIQPATGGVATVMSSIFNNGSTQAGFAQVTTGTMTFLTGTIGTFATTGFTPTGTKGFAQDTVFVYDVN